MTVLPWGSHLFCAHISNDQKIMLKVSFDENSAFLYGVVYKWRPKNEQFKSEFSAIFCFSF